MDAWLGFFDLPMVMTPQMNWFPEVQALQSLRSSFSLFLSIYIYIYYILDMNININIHNCISIYTQTNTVIYTCIFYTVVLISHVIQTPPQIHHLN